MLEKTLESSLDWKIKPVNPKVNQTSQFEYSLKALMLKLKLQYFGLLIETANSLENTLMLGKIEGKRRRGQQRMRWLDSITDSMDMILSKLQEIVKTEKPLVLKSMESKEVEWLREWTIITTVWITVVISEPFSVFLPLPPILFSTRQQDLDSIRQQECSL